MIDFLRGLLGPAGTNVAIGLVGREKTIRAHIKLLRVDATGIAYHEQIQGGYSKSLTFRPWSSIVWIGVDEQNAEPNGWIDSLADQSL